MAKTSRIPPIIKGLPDERLRAAIRELGNMTWDDDAELRKVSKEVYGEEEGDLVMQMLSLAIPMAREIEERTR